jgi:hypothetical protein
MLSCTQVFMTRRDIMQSVHEPFGDAFYYGPEFRSERFKDDPATREASGFSSTTYKDVLRNIEEAGKEVRSLLSRMTVLNPISIQSPKWGDA